MNEMIEFRTLGTPDLRDDSDRHAILSVLAQPKRVGLLAYLVMAEGGRAVSRDKLQAVFWPEASSDRARNSLKQAVFVLRRAMGDHLLVTNGEGSIGVNADRLGCDAWRFKEHIAAGEKPEALALYGGHFLEGLYVSGAPAFERWLEAERKRHRDLALAAASELTAEAESAGRSSEALEWARQAARLAPYDEDVHRRLLRCLLHLGNRAGAIRAYEAFAARLERDLGFEPCTETQALFELAHEEPTAASRAIPIGADGLPPTTRLPTTRARGGRLQAVAFVGTAIVFLAVGGLVGRAFERSMAARSGSNLQVDRNQVPALDSKRVLLAGFANLTGDPELDPFGLVAADWITQELGRTGLVRVVPFFTVLRETPYLELNVGNARTTAVALAEQTGAGILVTGSYVREGDGIALQAQIVDVATGELLAGVGGLTGSAEVPTEILAELPGRVAGALAGVLDPRLASWADVASPPPSIEAYRLYIEGLDRFFQPTMGTSGPSRFERYLEAAETLRRAAALDSSFTAPLIWAVFAYQNALEFGRADSLVRMLEAVEDRLAPWDHIMVAYHRAFLGGDYLEQYRAAKRVVELSPDSDWSYKLAVAALSLNRPREAADILLGMDPDRGWIREWRAYWGWLFIALHLSGDYEAELEAAERFRYRFPNEWSNSWEVSSRIRVLVGLGRTEEALQLAIDTDRPYWLWEVALHLRAHGHEKPAAQAIDAYLSKWGDGADTMPPLRSTAQFLEEVGRWDEAGRVIERGIARWSEAEGSTQPLSRPQLNSLVNWRGEAGVLAAKMGEPEEAERHLRWLEELELPYSFGGTTIWQAQIAAQLGEKEQAVEFLRRAFAEGYANHTAHYFDFFHLDPLRDYPPFVELMRPRE